MSQRRLASGLAFFAFPRPFPYRQPRPALPRVEGLEVRSLLSVVLPGGAVALAGTTAAARPELAGTVVRDALIPFSVSDGIGPTIFKGTLQDRVVKETRGGTLDFYETIRADAGFTVAGILDYVTRSNFRGVSTDVDYRTDGIGSPTIKPERATRSADGVSVKFAFGFDTVNPGDTSEFFFIKTNAKAFDLKGSTAIGFGQGPTSGSGNGSVKLTTSEPVAATGSISGVKYNDVNGNGVRDPNDPGLPRWTIYIDANGNKQLDPNERRTLTDGSGNYSFTGLAPGKYTIREVLQAGWRQTAPTAGAYNVTVNAGNNLNGKDFGNTKSVLVAGGVVLSTTGAGLAGFRVYIDANNNKTFDAGEKFVVTAAPGTFRFAGLAAGTTHHVRVAPMVGFALAVPASGEFAVNLASGAVATGLEFIERKV